MNDKATKTHKPYLDCYKKGIKVEHLALLLTIQERQDEGLSIVEYNREYFPESSNVTVGNWIIHCESLRLIVITLDPLNRRVKMPKLTARGTKLLLSLA